MIFIATFWTLSVPKVLLLVKDQQENKVAMKQSDNVIQIFSSLFFWIFFIFLKATEQMSPWSCPTFLIA